MFKGRKCSKRCKNSLSILLRQKSAAKLATCYCDGTEDFSCHNIRDNTDKLCFGKNKTETETVNNEVDTGGGRDMGWDTMLAVLYLVVTYLVTDLGTVVRTSVETVR